MHTTTHLRLTLAHEHLARARREAEQARLAEEATRRHRPTLRQRAGVLLIAAGRRLATEPHNRLARSS